MPVLNKYGGEVEIEEVNGVDRLVFRIGSKKFLWSRKQCYGWGVALCTLASIFVVAGGAMMAKEVEELSDSTTSIALLFIGILTFSVGIAIMLVYRFRRTRNLTARMNAVNKVLAMSNHTDGAVAQIDLDPVDYIDNSANTLP